MPARKRRPNKAEEQHTHLTLRIDSYEAGVEAAVNHNVYAPEYAWGSDEEDPVYEFDTRLTITGTSLAPPGRAGDTTKSLCSAEIRTVDASACASRMFWRGTNMGRPGIVPIVARKFPSTTRPKALGSSRKAGIRGIRPRGFLFSHSLQLIYLNCWATAGLYS